MLAHVRAGSEVVIDSDLTPIAVLVPPTEHSTTTDPAHDAWVREQVQEALDDVRPGIPAEEVEGYFAQRRASSMIRATGRAE